jgi:hypothetical protein
MRTISQPADRWKGGGHGGGGARGERAEEGGSGDDRRQTASFVADEMTNMIITENR